MEMPYGKFKGQEVCRLPRPYLKWLKDKATGPLQVEVFRALGLPAPKQPPPETLEEIQDRTIREVMERFAERERRGDHEDVIAEL